MSITTTGFDLYNQGRYAEAAKLCHAHPDDPEAKHLLGLIALMEGRTEEAEGHIREAMGANPASARFRYGLAQVCLAQGRLEEAAELLRMTVLLAPGHIAAHVKRGEVLTRLGRQDQAVACYTQALAVDPDNVQALLGIAEVAISARRHVEAGEALRRVLTLEPNNALANDAWGRLIQFEHRFTEAEVYLRKAVDLAPNRSEPLANLARCLFSQGRIGESADCYRKALALAQGSETIHSQLLFTLLHDPDLSAQQILEAHVEWDRTFGGNATGSHDNTPDPERRLKVGYISQDMWDHPVAFFFLPVLKAHDRTKVEIYCYADTPAPDHMTERLKAQADHWRDTLGTDNKALAATVDADGIDILVDMAGHLGSRLGLFTHKPAPVQVSWMGYLGGTGLSAIDARLTDPFADPTDGADKDPLLRLPRSFLAFQLKDDRPAVPAPPARANGFVTFGSFNKLAKINDKVLALWAEIMTAVPGSRLLLKCSELRDQTLQARLREAMESRGVAGERVEMMGYVHSSAEHLGLYGRIDIVLDAFPWNGGTTTVDALMMGKPVITLAEPERPFRMGASLLGNLDLAELIAEDGAGYVAKAVALAEDLDRLEALTAGMGDRLAHSPLTDVTGFTRDLEEAYRKLWKDWCRGRLP